MAIVADKPQTTRTSIQGVVTLPDAQIVFVDTPGIHKADTAAQQANDGRRSRRRSKSATCCCSWRTLPRAFGADRTGARSIWRAASRRRWRWCSTKSIWCKEKGKLLPLIEQYRTRSTFVDFVPVSAARGKGLDELRKVILAHLPEGPMYFPEDHVTDQPERFLAAELIREKVLLATRREVPHSIAVMVDKWEETPRLTRIYATIRVERDGQKGIVIGAKGAMLKKIGTLAREDMERLFGIRIFLESAREGATQVARKGRIPERARLAYNGW